jgi:hypothetical protein
MARTITDNPGGWSRSLPGHTVEFEASFAQPFYNGATVGVVAGGTGTYSITISDTEHIFFPDMISVTPQAYKEFAVIVYVNGSPYVAASGIGWLNIPLRQNPSIQLISGDILRIDVTNLDASARNFLIKFNGTKIVRPVNFGHAPGAYFTVNVHSLSIGQPLHLVDGSQNNPTSWDWDFDDGLPHHMEQSPWYVWYKAGSYHPKLKVINQYGYDTYAEAAAIVVS